MTKVKTLLKKIANIELNTETELREIPRTPETPETLEPTESTEVAGSDEESSDRVLRPSSWFIGTQRDIMYHGVGH